MVNTTTANFRIDKDIWKTFQIECKKVDSNATKVLISQIMRWLNEGRP